MANDTAAVQAAGGIADGPSSSRIAKRNPLYELNMMLTSPYYMLNIMLTSLYVVFREYYRHKPIQQGILFFGEITDYDSWERYVAFLCGSYGAFRFVKARSRLQGLTALLDFAQLFVAIMAMVCSPILLAYLVLAYGLIYLLIPQPMYPLNEVMDLLTPERLMEDVKRSGTDVTWVVLYYAPWHPACRHMAPDVADLARRYGTDKLKFACLDLGEYSKTAEKLGIELSPVSQQLPALVLYEKGEEVVRIPQKKTSGSLYAAGYKAKDVIRAMELDMRFTRAMQKSVEKKGQ
ncbi:hypothetical protein VOLCADRAFT_96764 [Volvox carteri f. nagariensis]|uniref:Thioredoxin domain-containing protein n=1 Tax=Volvox carteri f. nagariensis TaxID=3068 RepID=D8UAZ7_VOLCA|nr:uncharacterized protein VOLCADRAFT_96764 [Volvox carteri f. nagariensis]EFJ43081.1 hypothetical protein VOLCADRAFT_96764 [Volvox carteri f. nagariensis]|eukprot:XP_002955880.1 hypothetical protein VOLCADRAFT_96764 [Volvox carteri f. nagariensis]